MPPIKLMLVDDFNVVRVGLYKLLQAQPDIEVVAEANPGAEAVALAQTYHPDVVLMDVKMPGTNEMEATRQLKACCPAVAILALMIYDSIYEARKHFIHMFDAGASGCILGQATPEDLLQAIRTVHRGRFS